MNYMISKNSDRLSLSFTERAVRLLATYGLIASISVLLLNDFVLKAYFGNFITGKLSDLAGLFAAAIFVSIFMSPRGSVLTVAVLFVWWKTPFSQPIIDLMNAIGLGPIGRAIDYSDYIALIVLIPVKKYIASVLSRPYAPSTDIRSAVATLFSVISVFAFTATSFVNERSVWVKIHYTFNIRKTDFEDRIARLPSVREVKIEKETDVWPKDKYPDVETDPRDYFLGFRIQEKFCDSSEIKVFTSFRDDSNKQEIDGINFKYWCSVPPTKEDEKKLIEIVEQQMIKPLSGIIQND
jgi:hypothetical protein